MASKNLWLNSGLLSDCFYGDGLELAQLGTDIHSPIQSIERWLPLGHKSQLLLRHTAIGPSEGHFRSKQACVPRGETEKEREKESGRCGLAVCTNEIVHGQWQKALLNCSTCPTNFHLPFRVAEGSVPFSIMIWFIGLAGDIILSM